MLPACLQLGIDFCLVVFGWHAGFWDQDLRRLMSGRGRRMGRIAGKELGLHSHIEIKVVFRYTWAHTQLHCSRGWGRGPSPLASHNCKSKPGRIFKGKPRSIPPLLPYPFSLPPTADSVESE